MRTTKPICLALISVLIFSAQSTATSGQNPCDKCSAYELPDLTVKARTYYVNNADSKASDENDGLSPAYAPSTGSGPWKTIRKAASVMTAGDAAYIRAGTYKESNIIFRSSGKLDAPIILSAYGPPDLSKQVVIDGDGSPKADGIILADGASSIFVQGVTVQNMTGAGIALKQEPTKPCKNILLHKVTLTSNGIGIRVSAANSFTLHSVHVYKNKDHGILLENTDSGYLIESESQNNGQSGVALFNCKSITICGCSSSDNRASGFEVANATSNIILEHNSSFNNTQNGFLLLDASNNNILTDNIAYKNNEVGFALIKNSNNLITGNKAYENTIQF